MVIVIHEVGHFLFARLNGIKVIEFAIGMGPRIFSKQGKETLYSVRAIPFGGFCLMEGEDSENVSKRSFGAKKVWRRVSVIAAGGIFNIILGLIFVTIIVAQQDHFYSTTVNGFTADSKAYAGGLMSGDKIVSINKYNVICANDISFSLATASNGKIDFEVLRDGKKIKLDTIQLDVERIDTKHTRAKLDFYVKTVPKTVLTLPKEAFLETVSFVRVVYKSLFMLIGGRVGVDEVSGPVGTVSAIGEVAQEGFKVSILAGINNMLYIMALISVNLGIVNLLPLPALDGGRLMFLFYEGITRKKVNPKYEGLIHAIGLALLISLIVFATYNDIMRLIKGS